jgi:hypothetical protein
MILLVVLSTVLLSGALLTGCGRATGRPDLKVEATPDEGSRVPTSQTPVQTPPPPTTAPPATKPLQSDDFSSSGLPSDVADALLRHIRGDERYSLGHWLALEDGSHLVEMRTAPTGEHLYMWVPCGGKEARVLVGLAEAPVFADIGGEAVRFLCTCVGDTFGVYPYYEVVRPGGLAEEAPFFKAPNADIYTCSVPGLGYELRKVVSDETSLDLLFMITGADPEGVMAGGGRPPAATIVESDGVVAVRLWYVTLAPGTEEAIKAFSSSAARLKSAFWADGYLELEFSVSWKYAVTLVGEEGEPKPGDRSQGLGGYRLRFLPKPEEPMSGATSLHDVAAAISGVRVAYTTVTAPRLVGELQKHLLRPFPARHEPHGSDLAADVALLTEGQWTTEKGAYVAGAEGAPSYMRWQDVWYELEPPFDALLRAAGLADRDSMGDTPETVAQRYLLALPCP